MTSEEKREFEDYKTKKIPELRKILKEMEDTNTINNKYWHLKIEHLILLDDYNSLSNHYLGLMKLCVECVEHSKNISPEILKHWMNYWGCFVMDITGEAHCVLRHPYYPKYWIEAVGQEKKEWEEIIELSNKFYKLYPREKDI